MLLRDTATTERLFANVTYACNQSCAHCYASAREPQDSVPEELSASRLLDLVSQLRPTEVRLSGGEPLLYGQLADVVDGLRARSAVYSITTNGKRLEEGTSDLLLSYRPRSIHFSLLAATSVVHDRLAGSVGSYLRVLKGIEWCVKNRISARVNYSLFRSGTRGIDELLDHLQKIGVDEVRLFPLYPHGRAISVHSSESMGAVEHTRFVAAMGEISQRLAPMRLSLRPRFGSSGEEFPEPERAGGRCVLGRKLFLTVEPSGEVYPCCFLAGIPRFRIDNLSEDREAMVRSLGLYQSGDPHDLPCIAGKAESQPCPLIVRRIS